MIAQTCDCKSADQSFFVFRFDKSNFNSLNVTMARKCTSSPNSFRFISRKFTITVDRCSITMNIKKLYHNHFGTKLGDQVKDFALHVACILCIAKLYCSTIKNSRTFLLVLQWYGGSTKTSQ